MCSKNQTVAASVGVGCLNLSGPPLTPFQKYTLNYHHPKKKVGHPRLKIGIII